MTKDPIDWGKLKTPTPRDVSKTAPYVNDGRFQTLEEVVDFYDKAGIPNLNLDEKIKKLNLTDGKMRDRAQFLRALDGAPIKVAVPTAFPE